MEPRVASRLASFGASGAKALDFSAAPLVRLRLPVGLRVSPRAAPSGFASGRTFESPRIPAPLAPGDGVAEFPQPPHPPALPSLRLRVSPNPASTAGLTVTPRFSSNFASSAWPRMSIRFQSGRVYSSPDLDAFLNLIRACRLPASRPAQHQVQPLPASSAGVELRFQSLSGHQLERSLGLFNLWKQVQKSD